jgi:bacillithiol synthase
MPPIIAQETLRRIPFAQLKSFPPLFEQYCTNQLSVSEFFAGDFQSQEDRVAVAERAAGHPRDRDTLADVLLDQNGRWASSERTRHNIEALRDAGSVAVVTGQQVGILGGPLYTVLKTVTAIQLANRLAEETDRPVVPVFWLEGEDHDFDEVSSVYVMKGNEATALRYTPGNLPLEGNPGPIGRLTLTEDIVRLVDELEGVLQPTDFKDEIIEIIRSAYQPGTTLLDAFARLMAGLFPDAGLVFINPGDARLKRLAAPLFHKELEEYQESSARLHSVSERLSQRFHAQVSPRPLNLFLITEKGRFGLEASGDRFQVRGTDQTFTRAELDNMLDEHPERFSPNVVLRPIMQDYLLPTAAYVGGPAEVSYFAQFRPVYDWAGVPMPVIFPRASVTFTESKVQKVLDRYELTIADLDQDFERLFQQVVVGQMAVDVDEVFGEAIRRLHEVMDGLRASVASVDKTLGGATDATRTMLVKELEKFKGRVVKAEKRGQEDVRAQLEKAYVNLFPAGRLQERALSPLYFLNKYGPDLLTRLAETLSLDTTAHQVVEL